MTVRKAYDEEGKALEEQKIYVYINRGWKCECNSRNCHFPSYTTVAEYLYRYGEIVYYSFGG